MAKLLVTGWGRGGTQYTARLLAACGLRVSHEDVYRDDLDPAAPDRSLIWSRWEGDWVGLKSPSPRDAEVSWLAAPFLKDLPAGTAVWHQIRNPLKVVRCWRHNLTLSTHAGVAQFAHKAVPACGEGDNLARAVQYVLGWHRLIEDGCRGLDWRVRYKVEELNPVEFRILLAASGFDVSGEAVEAAFAGTPRDHGHCAEEHLETTWADVLRVPGGQELRDLATRLGYGEAA
jgi:hypothetical protein